jgi:fatty-acyl-CoA synthase
VRFAAAVGVYHPKWDERPVLIVVPTEDQPLTAVEVLEFLRPRMAKWWLPACAGALAHTAESSFTD